MSVSLTSLSQNGATPPLVMGIYTINQSLLSFSGTDTSSSDPISFSWYNYSDDLIKAYPNADTSGIAGAGPFNWNTTSATVAIPGPTQANQPDTLLIVGAQGGICAVRFNITAGMAYRSHIEELAPARGAVGKLNFITNLTSLKGRTTYTLAVYSQDGASRDMAVFAIGFDSDPTKDIKARPSSEYSFAKGKLTTTLSTSGVEIKVFQITIPTMAATTQFVLLKAVEYSKQLDDSFFESDPISVPFVPPDPIV